VLTQFETLVARLPEFRAFLTPAGLAWLAVVLAGIKVLHELGRVTAGMGRIATAVVYLERACELAPDDLAIRRTLADLGRKPRATVKLKERAALSPAPPRRRPQI